MIESIQPRLAGIDIRVSNPVVAGCLSLAIGFGLATDCLAQEPSPARFQAESLGRGLVAVPGQDGDGVFLSWRMLATDPANIAFDLFRDGTPIEAATGIDATCFFDSRGRPDSEYLVRVSNGTETLDRDSTSVWSHPSWRIPLDVPPPGVTDTGRAYRYTAGDTTVGDLDGDGQYEFVLLWQPDNARDNSQRGFTGNVLLDAYQRDGTRMWRIDLGRNVRAGAHYTPLLVYDLDGDGRAELVCRTSDGTRDGKGKTVGNVNADHRNRAGYVLSGPEYLTVFDGQTGAAMASRDFVPSRGRVEDWGDDYGNRVDRFLACVAYLDGNRPSLIFSRGYYQRTVLAAWDWRDGQLTSRWVFDSDDGTPGHRDYRGQGAHSLAVGDVDADGRDEIVFGAATFDDDGRGLYSTGLGHGDALHLGDFVPDRPGLEVFMVHEDPRQYGDHGTEMHAAEDGRILWSRSGRNRDVGRGLTADLDVRHPGSESWSSSTGLTTASGQTLSRRGPRATNFAIWWDGDLQRELLDGTTISKWDAAQETDRTLLQAADAGAASINGSKSTPCLSADLWGDWREEVVFRSRSNDALLIFTTNLPTRYRMPTLMHDRQYRLSIAWQNVGYNQPPHPSTFPLPRPGQ